MTPEGGSKSPVLGRLIVVWFLVVVGNGGRSCPRRLGGSNITQRISQDSQTGRGVWTSWATLWAKFLTRGPTDCGSDCGLTAGASESYRHEGQRQHRKHLGLESRVLDYLYQKTERQKFERDYRGHPELAARVAFWRRGWDTSVETAKNVLCLPAHLAHGPRTEFNLAFLTAWHPLSFRPSRHT